MNDLSLLRIDHLAFITNDLPRTIHFWRDLLGLPLTAAMGDGGARHYTFGLGRTQIAFFAYDEAAPLAKKPHGRRTAEPRGFDHVSFSVSSCEALFAWRDLLVAAGVEPSEAVDHGVAWSIYFFDPNGIPLEMSWACVDLEAYGRAVELPIVADPAPVIPAARPRPVVVAPTPRERWTAKPGAGAVLRDTIGR